jgi:hypothetical protein
MLLMFDSFLLLICLSIFLARFILTQVSCLHIFFFLSYCCIPLSIFCLPVLVALNCFSLGNSRKLKNSKNTQLLLGVKVDDVDQNGLQQNHHGTGSSSAIASPHLTPHQWRRW